MRSQIRHVRTFKMTLLRYSKRRRLNGRKTQQKLKATSDYSLRSIPLSKPNMMRRQSRRLHRSQNLRRELLVLNKRNWV